MKHYTLITGASHGLGLEFARKCALLGHLLLLTSLPDENLPEIGKQLEKDFGISVQVLETDLTTNLDKLNKWISENQFSINFLINNAGFGGTVAFEKMSSQELNLMLDLNIKSVTQLTHTLIPNLKKNHPSYILNISSMAGNFAFPYKAVYSASKAYIRNFSLALSEELKPDGISVSVLQPGAMPTNDVVKIQLNKGGFFANLSTKSAKEVAELAIEQTLLAKRIITPGWQNKASLLLMKIIPAAWARPLLAKQGKTINSTH